MTKVKICGIRKLEDAVCARRSGADFIGLNFVRSSKRRVQIDVAQKIILEIRLNFKNRVKFVGVFQNQTEDYVNMVAENLDLDYIQLHGQESQKYASHMTKPVIKTFSLVANFDVEEIDKKMKSYIVDYYLLDRKVQGEGEGLSLDKVKILCLKYPVFLAGGLDGENVNKSINTARPFAVDVAGGVETEGRIDCQKVKKFITNSN